MISFLNFNERSDDNQGDYRAHYVNRFLELLRVLHFLEIFVHLAVKVILKSKVKLDINELFQYKRSRKAQETLISVNTSSNI